MNGNKPLEEWTLKECKDLCEITIDCPNCPLARVCGECGFGIPEEWPIGG